MTKAICPSCGHEFLAGHEKGSGKATGALKTKLSQYQLRVLNMLVREGIRSYEYALTTKEIYGLLRDADRDLKEWFRTEHYVGFCLSDMLGAGLLEMAHKKCEVRDRKTQTIRFRKKPVWSLSKDYVNGRITVSETGEIQRTEQEIIA